MNIPRLMPKPIVTKYRFQSLRLSVVGGRVNFIRLRYAFWRAEFDAYARGLPRRTFTVESITILTVGRLPRFLENEENLIGLLQVVSGIIGVYERLPFSRWTALQTTVRTYFDPNVLAYHTFCHLSSIL
jgi:hypothetical protein